MLLKKRFKAFTLVEIMLVMIILCIIMVASLPIITKKGHRYGNSAYIPTGMISVYAGSTLPEGWLLCDGSEVSRTVYENLFETIGVNFGNGNNSTTFNLPDFRLGGMIPLMGRYIGSPNNNRQLLNGSTLNYIIKY